MRALLPAPACRSASWTTKARGELVKHCMLSSSTYPHPRPRVQPPSATPPSNDDEDAEEARLAALEASVRGRSAKPLAPSPSQTQQNMSGGFAEWKEGQLFPEGWDNMDWPQRASELWMGKRGALYWMTQSAWYSVLILAFAWVLFRFVLPALGVYQLANDFSLQAPME